MNTLFSLINSLLHGDLLLARLSKATGRKDIAFLLQGDTSRVVPEYGRDALEKQIPLSAASVVKTAKGDLVGGAGGRLDASTLIYRFVNWNDVAQASEHGYGQCHSPTPLVHHHMPHP